MDESSFCSIDRLVELGHALGVATQVANSMNASLQAMRIPGARNPMQPGQLTEDQPLFYAVLDDKSVGPLATLRALPPHRRQARDQGDLRLEARHARLAARGEHPGGAQACVSDSAAGAK